MIEWPADSSVRPGSPAMETSKKYLAPQTLEEAVRCAQERKAMILAGATDVLPRWTRGLVEPSEFIVDVKRIAELQGTSRFNGEVRLGACATMSEIESSPLIRSSAPILARAAGRIACPQIRNRATIGGNLCNASPAADTAIPLILLDAVFDLASASGEGVTLREVPAADFFQGPGSTLLARGEILTSIRFRPLPEGVFAVWDKFGTRPAMEIAVASVGVVLKMEGKGITHARIGYGSVAPTPMRGFRVEAELMGNPLSAKLIEKCVVVAREEIAPITDVRATAAYRREMVGVMLRRMLQRAQCAG